MRLPPARRHHHQSRAHMHAGLYGTAAGATAAKKHNHLALGIEKVGLVSKLGIKELRSVSKKSDRNRTSVSKNWMGIENIGSVSNIGIEKI